MRHPISEKLKQIVLCRGGKCIDLYYNDVETDIKVDDIIECESLKDIIFKQGGKKNE